MTTTETTAVNTILSAAPRVGTLADQDMLTGPLDRRQTLLSRTRAMGLDHVFVADHISFFVGFGMDGLIQAATIAALEAELVVHVGVYLLALRHPVPVARQIASLCESAPGRLSLGIGVGGEDRHEVEICGVDPATRGRRTNESLTALRGLLGGNATTFHGEFFDFEEALILPAPDPAVPIVIGGRSDAAIRRAALLGDGWLGVWCSAKRYAEVVAQIDDASAERDLPPPPNWDHGLQVWVGLGDDRNRARARLAKAMERMYQIPFERFERYSPFGTPAEVADALAPYVAAGCRHFNVMPIADSTEAAIEGVAEIRERLRASAG
jgi:alkanesulfonate monooxygenase SsuD/methylene tetrahydromethanopterin reductase-like flavin-dependent oxidoreductase (luciferase family)